LDESEFLYLTTIGWKTRKHHKIEIWFVEYNKRYYIMSERWKRAHWVQNIIHNPSILFTVNYKILKGTTRIVDRDNQPKLAAEVSNLMNTKYRWNEGLIVEIIPD
jgi:hypothetical protein